MTTPSRQPLTQRRPTASPRPRDATFRGPCRPDGAQQELDAAPVARVIGPALLLAADGALDGDGAAGLGDDRPDGRLAAVGAAVLRAVDGAIADVTDDLAPLRLALPSGEPGW